MYPRVEPGQFLVRRRLGCEAGFGAHGPKQLDARPETPRAERVRRPEVVVERTRPKDQQRTRLEPELPGDGDGDGECECESNATAWPNDRAACNRARAGRSIARRPVHRLGYAAVMSTADTTFLIRLVRPDEYVALGDLTVAAYRTIPYSDAGSRTTYFVQLRDVELRAATSCVLVAVTPAGELLGGVTYVGGPDDPYSEELREGEAGIRMLAVDPARQWSRRRSRADAGLPGPSPLRGTPADGPPYRRMDARRGPALRADGLRSPPRPGLRPGPGRRPDRLRVRAADRPPASGRRGAAGSGRRRRSARRHPLSAGRARRWAAGRHRPGTAAAPT